MRRGLILPFTPAERRLVAGAGIGMAGGFAATFNASFSLFLKPISADLGVGRAGVSLLVTGAFLGYAIGALILGPLYDRLGARRVLAVGMTTFAALLALLGIAPLPLAPMVGLCLLLGIAGATTAPTGYVLILSKAVTHRLGLALGLAMLGVGIGIVAMPLVTQRLIAGFGWRGAYIALGLFALATGCSALALIGRAHPARVSTLATAGDGVSPRAALASWRLWLIGVHALLLGGVGFGASTHFVAIVTDNGLTPQAAAKGAAMVGLGLFGARLGAALLLDYVFAPLVAAAACVMGAIGLVLLTGVGALHPGILPLAAVLIGLLVGSEGDTLPYLVRRYFGTRSFGTIFGGVICMGALGGMAGPIVLGSMFDRFGDYTGALRVGAALAAASGLSLLLLGRYPRDADRSAPE